MGIKDEVAGRTKEALGALADDDDLRREGKADRVAGKLKDGVDSAKDKLSDAVDAVKNTQSHPKE